MGMLPEGIIPIGEGNHGRVFDFVCESGTALITDYRHLDKDVWAENSIEVKLGGEKERITVTSIESLKDTLNKFLSAALKILFRHTPSNPIDLYTYPDFSNIKKDLLIEQLIFDILFDKYLDESELMTRNGYSTYMSMKLYEDSIQQINCARAINENLSRGMKTHYNRMRYSQLRKQLAWFSIDPDKYDKYYTPNIKESSGSKKPQFLWDLFYYNFGRNLKNLPSDGESKANSKYGKGMLSSRQYRCQLTKDSRNYSYVEIIHDLRSYNCFVNKILPVEFESYEKYFHMSMDYYVLESYKRVDFIFKLIDALPPDKLIAIDRDYFLVESRLAHGT